MRHCMGSCDDLPCGISVMRYTRFDKLHEITLDILLDFTYSVMELRQLVVTNLSIAQRRMVKMVDVRDLHCVYITSIMQQGMPLIQLQRQALGAVQAYYPEMIHRILIFNAPKGFASLWSIISSVMNERQRAKVQVYPTEVNLQEMANCLNVAAIHQWVSRIGQ